MQRSIPGGKGDLRFFYSFNVSRQRRAGKSLAKLDAASRRVLRPQKLDGCHLSRAETQIFTHFKLHAVDLCEIP